MLALVVDDEPIVSRVLSRLLTLLGWTCQVRADARSELEWLDSNAQLCDLVCLDMMLPDRDGRELLQDIGRLAPELPVVLTTGFEFQEVAAHLQSRPHLGYLQKPYSVAQLSGALQGLSPFLNRRAGL